jgi:putative DNA primase/helicase
LAEPPDETLPIPQFRTHNGAPHRPSPDLLETIQIMQRCQAVARPFVEDRYMQDGGLVLHSYPDDFYQWDGTQYCEVDRRDLRARAYEFVEHAIYLHPKEGPLPFAPTQRKIADLLDALHAVVLVQSGADAPLWIDRRPSPAVTNTIAMLNGLLDVRTRVLHPHTPQFFLPTCVAVCV